MKEARSSIQTTVALYDFLAGFSHEPASSIPATPTAQVGGIVKAVRPSQLPSISKQGTSDVGSYRPGSGEIITTSSYKAQVEKK
jgi:hypothetical protein